MHVSTSYPLSWEARMTAARALSALRPAICDHELSTQTLTKNPQTCYVKPSQAAKSKCCFLKKILST